MMDSPDTEGIVNQSFERALENNEAETDSRADQDILDSTERTPLLTSGALYTPREILNSSTTQRSFRNTNSYIARLAYYSNLRLPENALAVPPHIAAQYLVLPQSQQLKEGGRQSSLVTIFAIWNTMMGTSMLSMAWGLQQSGFILGLGLLIGMGLVCCYTANRIVRAQYHVPRGVVIFEFPDICRVFLGKWAETTAGIFGLLTFFGAMLVYWTLLSTFLLNIGDFIHIQATTNETIEFFTKDVLCSNSSSSLDAADISNFETFWNAKTVPLYLIVIIMPLLNMKDAVIFTKFNSLGTISVAFITVLTTVKMSLWGVNWSNDPVSEHYVELANGKFPSLMGMLCLAYSIHSAIITLLKNNARQENNSRDLAIGFSLVALTYTFVGTMVFISFPLSKNCIDQNFIKNLTSYDGMAIIARFFLFLQMSTVFPLLAFLFRVNFLYVLFKVQDFPGYSKVIALNMITIGICAIIAIFYPNVGDIIGWSGAISGLVYVFLLPCLVNISIRKMRRIITPKYYILQYSLIFLGVFILGAKIATAITG